MIQVLEVPYDGPVDENLQVIRKKDKKEKGAKGEAVPSSSSAYVVSAVSCRHILLAALWAEAAAYPQMSGMPGMPGMWYGMYYGMQPSSDPHAAERQMQEPTHLTWTQTVKPLT